MKQLIFILFFLSHSISHASLVDVDDMIVTAQRYGVDPTHLLQPSDIKLADIPKGVVRGEENIVEIKGQVGAFFLYGSRILYIQNKSFEAISRAFEITSSLPPPRPIVEFWNKIVQVLSPEHMFTTYDVRASQSKYLLTVTTLCKGSTHHILRSPSDRLVQNKWVDCVDQDYAEKKWFPFGWQSNQIFKLSDSVTAVLIHNMTVIQRYRIGIITPTKNQMFEMGLEVSEQTLVDILRRLGPL